MRLRDVPPHNLYIPRRQGLREGFRSKESFTKVILMELTESEFSEYKYLQSIEDKVTIAWLIGLFITALAFFVFITSNWLIILIPLLPTICIAQYQGYIERREQELSAKLCH